MITLTSVRTVPSRWLPLNWPWLLVATGWVVALVATADGQDWVLNHHILIEGGRLPLLAAGLVFLVAWQLMTVTMMLPSSMATLGLFRRVNRAHAGGGGTTAAFLAGYAATWTWFGVIAFAGDILVHQLIHRWSWLAWHPWMIAGTTLLVAGVFQFSPLKERCLAQCRTPSPFFVCHYREGQAGAWKLGLEHGKLCLGSCWALMLVMFGLGMGNVAWMAGLTGVMLLERTSWSGRNLVPLLGSAMVAWGVLVLVHPLWLPALLIGAR